MDFVTRPSTPNTVMYEEDLNLKGGAYPLTTTLNPGERSLRPPSIQVAHPLKENPEHRTPPPFAYENPDEPDQEIRQKSNLFNIWTMDDESGPKSDLKSENEDNQEKTLLDKEFPDFYDSQVHRSSGTVIFISKMLGLLPVIWIEEQEDGLIGECKSYFNFYTFLVIGGWVTLAVFTAIRCQGISTWPGSSLKAVNATDKSGVAASPLMYISNYSFDTFFTCIWCTCLVALFLGVIKCRCMSDVLFGLSEIDTKLEMKEKQYSKLQKKSMYWTAFLACMLGLQATAFFYILNDMNSLNGKPNSLFEILLLISDVLATTVAYALDLQFFYLCTVLAKRYRLLDKVLQKVTEPWSTLKAQLPSNLVLQAILQHRFDQPTEGEEGPASCNLPSKPELFNKAVPLELLRKLQEEPKITKEVEGALIFQLDILRDIHAHLSGLVEDVDALLGFQLLIHIIGNSILVVMFGYFVAASALELQFYWPYLVLFLLPLLEIYLIGHWGQVLTNHAKKPFLTICQLSTVEGTPRLERQVQKLASQMHHCCPSLTAGGYFPLKRHMLLTTLGFTAAFAFFMINFNQLKKITKIT